MTSRNLFDVMVVAAGLPVLRLAASLSEDPSRTVLLLEAGPAYKPGGYPDVLLNAERLGGDEEHTGVSCPPGPRGRTRP